MTGCWNFTDSHARISPEGFKPGSKGCTLMIHPERAPHYIGHNPLQQLSYTTTYVVSIVVMLTGFAMYGEAQGMQSWTFAFFTSWVMPLLGYSQMVHTLHHLGMWYLLVFTIVHLYMVMREDAMSGETIISTMFSGWRVAKK